MTKNKRSQQEWFSLIERCESLSSPVKEFCKKEGVNPSNYYYWAKRYRTKESGFAPLEIRSTNYQQHVPAYFCELTYPNGTTLRLNQRVSPGELSQLLKLF